jgi:hypothetical protein
LRINPALPEARATLAELRAILGTLGLEETPATVHARRAVSARWAVVEGGKR